MFLYDLFMQSNPLQHVITAYPFHSEKRPNRQRKLYIISQKAKTCKTTTKKYVLGNVGIVAIVNKSKIKANKKQILKILEVYCDESNS